jgi:cytochrome b6-f complex iron-sulfur subunit
MKSLMRHVDRLSRRRLLGLPLDMLAAVAALTTAGAGLLRLPMPKVLPTPSSRFRIGRATDFPPGTERYFEAERVLVRADATGLSALSFVCTHLGCTVAKDPAGQGLVCPCHGSRYRADGSLVAGPAPRRLRTLAITAEPSGWLLVDAGQEVPAGTKLEV